ncbi:MAG: hypothetical protein Q9162_001519 [Coniocarpon cinnabarinum]
MQTFATDLNHDRWPGTQDMFTDFSNLFTPNHTFNTSELTNEYNLLNDFLNSSLLDDTPLHVESSHTTSQPQESLVPSSVAATMNNNDLFAVAPGPGQNCLQMPMPLDSAPYRANTSASEEKKKETYYLTAADPGGTGDDRMDKMLKAKIDAGMLRPFNYAKAWGALNEWLARNVQPASRDRITKQFENFRPKFRQRTEKLTDVELTKVEWWFERQLMEYDRVFASMAIPACCWRRTGGIHRGNREMAELLKVRGVEELRDVRKTPNTRSSGTQANQQFVRDNWHYNTS